ncbi:MAG: hypothetical protein COW00_15980 [Bdellovibrio sp. CG12_big_fil_rev_8_21_14_0_65_39_13]|nr:MAG: hypothetical protein COW78_02355 [Bdellovibrio sp. CG22_combo_CG10-13_8_21_14_all_39_27]PIQ58342.1 MAG: hypothetical protein COW00_15980 [Bdellovibrio sp. CG12_big_fil_rev_8_21_14_0_65_39_13]PIR35855.1 MAG: hypothetical protein COV37_06560 [Bdellovibrio sp. CG11_big_fil_rev_8_21_14_0_20_39_38]PJB54538.1 MAG: hypothetical protein CO099_01015 [Bdellovibrio sp. CG_4_9_14_3_um_filter_39_7]
MKKTILTFAGLLLTTGAFAQATTSSANTTSTNALSDFYGSLKASPLKFTFIEEFAPGRNENNDLTTDTWSNTITPYFSYKLNDRNSLAAYGQWSTSKSDPERAYTTAWSNLTFDYSFKNILTEDSNGIGMNFVARQRFFMDAIQNNKATSGYSRVGAKFYKTIGKVSGSADVLFAKYHQNSEVADATTADTYFYIPANVSLTLGEKGYVAFLPEYFRQFATETTDSLSNNLSAAIEGGYQVTDQLGLALNIGQAELVNFNGGMQGVADRKIKANPLADLDYTFQLSMSVF